MNHSSHTQSDRPAVSDPAEPIDAWHRSLIGELRMREVPGTRIGDVLAEIEAHCADSHQAPAEAFGDPVEYAASIAGPSSPARRPWLARICLALRFGLMFSGILTTLSATRGLSSGESAVVTAGELLSLTLGTLAIPIMTDDPRRLASWRTGMAIMVPALSGMILPQVLWRHEVWHAPAGWLLGYGLAAVVASCVPTRPSRLRDRIIDPRTGRDRLPVTSRTLALLVGLPAITVGLSIAAILMLR